jgi:protocatechuate 3,4-dioxygenase beta subunit
MSIALPLLMIVCVAVSQAAPQTPRQQQQQGQGGGRGGQGGGRGGQQGQGGNPQRPTRDNPNDPATQPTGTGTISGSVISNDGHPVRRARVTLTSGELRSAKSTTSDDQGRFTFGELPGGRFTLAASKPGYVNATYGQKQPGRAGTPIQLIDSQHLDDLKLALPKGGVITGMVLDEHNEAAPGTQVTAWRAEMRTGEKRFSQVGSDQTDDRGIYRIYGLLPGDYLVRATPRNSPGDLRQIVQNVVGQALSGNQGGRGGQGGGGRGGVAQIINGLLGDTTDEATEAYAPVYYPGTTTSTGATTVALAISQERQGVDFQLQLVQTATVSGMVTSPDGDASGILLMLVNETELAIGGGLNTARVQPDGTFTFSNVAPGQYVVQARQGGGRGGRGGGRRGQVGAAGGNAAASGGAAAAPEIPDTLWGETAVYVDGHAVTGVAVAMQPGMKIAGHVAFEGGQPPADLTRVRVVLSPVGQTTGLDASQTQPASLDARGNFTVTGIAPGRYTVRVQGQIPGMTLRSAVTAGRDILDFPLDVRANENVADLAVTMSNQTQELSGTLTDAQSMPATDYTVIVFAEEKQFWTPQARRIQSSRPGTDGRFIVRNLPPGNYLVAAVTDVEPGEWFDPAFLEQLRPASERVSLVPGDKKVQDLRLGGGGA